MMLSGLFFYLFSALLLLSGAVVISARNPVHAVLFLILAFFNAAGLFVLLGAEFLAMILVIVYVGAVAVLFLFVVMMLDVDFAALRSGVLNYVPLGGLVGGIVLAELLMVAGAWLIDPDVAKLQASLVQDGAVLTNTEELGRVLYTHHIHLFQTAGLILLVAMIGAIMLTLHHKPGVKRQNIARQNARTKAEAMALTNPAPGEGIEL